jgi:hypothetical protein
MGLLLIDCATKTTASFSRLDTSIWALASWLLLCAQRFQEQGGDVLPYFAG